jgi:hypothetical protein
MPLREKAWSAVSMTDSLAHEIIVRSSEKLKWVGHQRNQYFTALYIVRVQNKVG